MRRSLIAFLGFLPTLVTAAPSPIYNYADRFHPVTAQHAMVATQEHHASQIGIDVLEKGGNAVDAAVAIGFALAVTLPRAGNLGGGGFMMVYLAKEHRVIAIDFREKAPLSASKNMFLTDNGTPNANRSRYSAFSAGIPGTVAGLAYANDRYGKTKLKKLIAPAYKLAKHGFTVSDDLSQSLLAKKDHFNDAAKTVFLPNGETPPQPGQKLIQKDLAWSLKQLMRSGPKAFYQGKIADKTVAFMADIGGPITRQDLLKYAAIPRRAIQGTYRGYHVYAMPPPSSGGIHLVQMLNLLEGYNLDTLGHNSAETIHLMAETMKLAYADRSKYLGDPDFVTVPTRGLTSKKYANQLRKKIHRNKATPSKKIHPSPIATITESPETTHYSVIDKWGNMVSVTYTLNFSYGSGIMVPGTGILLNNEMDDFSAKPGAPNAYGLTGGEFNAIAPEKRPLSSMTPTLVLKDNQPFMATGSPGGSRIITTVLQILLNVIDHDMNIQAATNAPRIHHQWLPDELRIETGISSDTTTLLKAKGHTVVQKYAMGSTQSIIKKDGRLFGASDPRKPGALTIGL